MKNSIIVGLCLLLLGGCSLFKRELSYTERPQWAAFEAELVADGFSPEYLRGIIAAAKFQPEIIARMTRPAEALAWDRYRRIFLQPDRIAAGQAYLRQHAALFDSAEEKYGVDREIIAAILAVESRFGEYQGSHRVIDALVTLGFDYPPRADFFRSELAQFLRMCREQKLDPLAQKGSYAGAMGMPQFISSSYRHWAVDGDGDNVADLWTSHADVIHSVANYFAEHNWQLNEAVAWPVETDGKTASPWLHRHGKPLADTQKILGSGIARPQNLRGNPQAALIELRSANGDEYWLTLNNFYVITRYNHSRLYAMAVYQLSQTFNESQD